MHEGKCLSQLDKGKFALLETLYNDDKWRHGECFWSTLSDCTSSYIEVIMFSFLFPDSNRLYYGQHKSFTFFFLNIFDIVWHTVLKIVVGHCFWYHLGFQYCNLQVWISMHRVWLLFCPLGEKKKKDSMFPITKYTNTTLNTTAMCSLLSLPYCYLWHKESTGHCCAAYQREWILCK